MSDIDILGIDPGLVDTGLVAMTFRAPGHMFSQSMVASQSRLDTVLVRRAKDWHVFIEDYRPRGNTYGTDLAMRELMTEIKSKFPRAKVLGNMGVKQVITREMLELLDLWTFATPTHHQDLRSAARIALLGMAKDPVLNRVLYEEITSRLIDRGIA